MKIAVVGAGAIGGYLGAWLAAAGEDVTFIARGAQPRRDPRRRHEARSARTAARTSARTGRARSEARRDAGPQDVVLLTVKAHQVAAIGAELQRSVTTGHDHRHDAERHSVVVLPQARRPVRRARRSRRPIPTASIAAHIDPRRVIGSVVYPAAELDRARRGAGRRGQPLHARRTRRHRRRRASQAIAAALIARRIQGADHRTTSAARSGSSCGAT